MSYTENACEFKAGTVKRVFRVNAHPDLVDHRVYPPLVQIQTIIGLLDGAPKEVIGCPFARCSIAPTGKTAVHFTVVYRAERLFGMKRVKIDEGDGDNLPI